MSKLQYSTSKKLWLMGGQIFLIATWGMISLMLAVATESWLAPWDTLPFRPMVGTWERSINDFFEGIPGSWLPAVLVVVASIMLYAHGMYQTSNKLKLTWAFGFANILFIIMQATIPMWVRELFHNLLFRSEPQAVGYEVNLPQILVTLALLLALFVIQAIVSLTSKANIKSS